MLLEKTSSLARSWFDKVPSPTGSEDSGLGWSPSGAGDCLFRLENSEKSTNAYFNYSESESAGSPVQDSYKSWIDFDSNPKSDGTPADFQSFALDQKPVADLLDGIWDQKPALDAAGQQQNKKMTDRSSSKKKMIACENSSSTKLERCFQPKTGNGKPRQTSVKRKPSQKNTTAYPYPGVRVLTVREKLKKMRECRSQSSSPPSGCAYNNNNQAMIQNMPQTQFQQNFNQAVQQQHALQEIYSPVSRQSQTTTSLENTAPLHHISPSYAPVSVGSSSFPFDLESPEIIESYPQSLPSSSPTHSSHCSSPQQYPSSPETSPRVPAQFSPVSQCKEVQALNFSGPMQQMSNYRPGFEIDPLPNYPSPTFDPKVQVQNSYGVDEFVPAYDNSCSPNVTQFNNQPQYNYNYDLRSQVFQSVRHGHLQTLKKILSFKRECVDMCDESGKFPLLVAIECGQLEAMKLLLGFQANTMMATYDGKTILHAAAGCSKSDIFLHLLRSMHGKDILALIDQKTRKTGYTALHYAIEGKHINNLIQLLGCGANFLLQDNCGLSPLHIAIQNCDVMSVRALIQAADKTQKMRDLTCQRTGKMDTPLHLAADLFNAPETYKHQIDIIKLLVFSEADPCALNLSGIPPKNVLPLSNTSPQVLEAYYLMGGTGSEMGSVNVLQQQMAYPRSNLFNGDVCPHSQ